MTNEAAGDARIEKAIEDLEDAAWADVDGRVELDDDTARAILSRLVQAVREECGAVKERSLRDDLRDLSHILRLLRSPETLTVRDLLNWCDGELGRSALASKTAGEQS